MRALSHDGLAERSRRAMTMAATLAATLGADLAAALADPEAGWSLGAFGAAAEFRRRADEPFERLVDGRFGLRTARGGLALVLPTAVAAGRADLVFTGPLGRIEVAGCGLGDPLGPRGYLVPGILRLCRTHVATAPIPPGLVPCAHLLPPHPCRDAAGRTIPAVHARHAAFQRLLARWGDPDRLALKRALAEGGPVPPHVPDRWSRAVERVVRLQADRLRGTG